MLHEFFCTFVVLWTIFLGPLQTVGLSQPLQIATYGQNVTLECLLNHHSGVWFKQIVGQTPVPVGQFSDYQPPILTGEFKNTRFKISQGSGIFYLSIGNILLSDEGFYFCGNINSFDQQYGSGTYLKVKDENHINRPITKVIQDPVSGPVSPGGSETLECVVLTESRTEELSVFWFRPASGASHPGLIYINKSSSGQCEGRCVYTLSKKDVDITEAGTYYCAIATSGHILFGNGTTLRLTEPLNNVLVGLVVGMGCSCACCLAWLICKSKADTCKTSENNDIYNDHDLTFDCIPMIQDENLFTCVIYKIKT